jgi:hypothetical protein
VQLLDRLVGARHIRERRLRRVLGDHLRLGLAEVEHPRAATLHLRHEQQQQDHQDSDRQQVDQQAQEDAVAGNRRVVGLGDPARALGLLHGGPDLRCHFVRVLGLDLVGRLAVDPLGRGQVELKRLLLVLDHGLGDAGLAEALERDRGIYSLVARTTGEE